jgi:hypothetical protein
VEEEREEVLTVRERGGVKEVGLQQKERRAGRERERK